MSQRTYIDSMLERTRQNHTLAIVLFKKLFQDLPLQMQQVEQALAAGEMPVAIAIIHKLNGSMGFCGFLQLQKICNRLELALMQNQQGVINPLFLQLKKEINTFQNLQTPILQELEQSDKK